MNIARIVPVPTTGKGNPSRTQGTEVWVGDQKLSGVTRIELVAEVNDVWRAVIHCLAEAPDITAEAVVHRPSIWQRFLRCFK